MRCSGREDEEGRRRERKGNRRPANDGAVRRARQTGPKTLNSSRETEKGKFRSLVQRNSLYTRCRPGWPPSVLRARSLRRHLWKICQDRSFPPLEEQHQVPLKAGGMENKGKKKPSNLLPLQLLKLSFIYNEGLFDHPSRLHSGTENQRELSLETRSDVHPSPHGSDFIFHYNKRGQSCISSRCKPVFFRDQVRFSN